MIFSFIRILPGPGPSLRRGARVVAAPSGAVPAAKWAPKNITKEMRTMFGGQNFETNIVLYLTTKHTTAGAPPRTRTPQAAHRAECQHWRQVRAGSAPVRPISVLRFQISEVSQAES